MKPKRPISDAFKKYLRLGAPDECWEWTGERTWGYGYVNTGARLPLDLQGEFAGWWRKTKWKWPLTKVQAEDYEARLAVLETQVQPEIVDVPTGGHL